MHRMKMYLGSARPGRYAPRIMTKDSQRAGASLAIALLAIVALGAATDAVAQTTTDAAAQTMAPLQDAEAMARAALAQPDPILKGLVFLDDISDVNADGVSLPSTIAVDVTQVPALSDPRVAEMLAAHVGKPFNIVVLERIRSEVAGYFATAGRPFVRVTLPEQDATNGVVQFVAIESALGSIKVEGAKYFGERTYLNAVELEPGEKIDAARLERALAWLNTNPYRQVTPIALAGSAAGTTDIVLQAQERRPLAVGASIGNTGNPYNGEVQIGASLDWGNAFGRGDLAGVQYTTSSDRVINQVGGSYTARLPWRHTVALTGSYARTRPDSQGSDIRTHGASSGGSARYVWTPGQRSWPILDRLAAGVDYRRSNNDVLFGGETVFSTSAVVAQFVAEYSTNVVSRLGATNILISPVFSPGGIGNQNTDAVFAEQRAGATARYAYVRAAIGHAAPLPWGFTWNIRATGQLASAALLSSEQIAFGGEGSVRGFDAFAANRDEGIVATAELRLPVLSGVLFGSRGDANADELSLFVFADYGTGRLRGADAGPLRMASAGPALSYRAGRFGTVQLSYGRVLEHAGVDIDSRGRLHFQIRTGF